MPQKPTLKAKGIHSFYNPLGSQPDGSLTVADNVVIDRPDVIEQRRGFTQYGDDVFIESMKQIMTYKSRILAHYDDALIFDSDGAGAFSEFNGSYDEVEAGLRIKSLEANGNLYFTTAEGIKKISATAASEFVTTSGYITQAGGVKALDVTGTIDYTTTGFFSVSSKVAYRIVWGKEDENKNRILGAPSSRLVVTNYDNSLTATVDLSFRIPSAISTTDTTYFYQVYRTAVVSGDTSDDDPGEEFNLIIEDYPTSGQLTAKLVTLDDSTPETLRVGGAFLYTNPISGEGILQANEVPPIASDICLFKNTVFYANTETKQRLNLALLSVSDFVSATSTFTITDGTTTNTYTFIGTAEIFTALFDTQANTTDAGYFLFSSASNERKYFAWMDKTGATTQPAGADTAGRIPVRCNISASVSAADVATVVKTAIHALDDFTATVNVATVTITNIKNGNTTDPTNSAVTPVGGAFALNVTTQGTGENAASKQILLSSEATVGLQLDETGRSIVNIINQQSTEIVEAFYLSGENDIPGLVLLEAKTVSQIAFYLTANNSTTGENFNPSLPTSGSTVISDNEVRPNRVYFSKFQQPEAVPIVNFFDVGPRDKAIKRVIPLREAVYILKEDGIYRVTGETGSFVVDAFDGAPLIIAPDSAVALNNRIYFLSTQGIVEVSDTGTQIISHKIENLVAPISSAAYDVSTASFGVGYEIDRSYLLFTVTKSSDTYATQCFRFNTLTNSWVRWPISKTCGVVKPDDNKLYLGAADEFFIEQERKNFLRTDYADRSHVLSFDEGAATDDETIFVLSSVNDAEVGDALVQTQYVTIAKYNQLLAKLDADTGVTDTTYVSLLEMDPGDSMAQKLADLAAKLDADGGVTDTNYAASISGSTDFATLQLDYNIITAKLNLDATVTDTDYYTSSGTHPQESVLTNVTRFSSQVTLYEAQPFMMCPVTLYKGIKTHIEWSPEHLGDASVMKQYSEGTIMFENDNFTTAEAAYKSDLSIAYKPIEFTKQGNGDWGTYDWGDRNWGGLANASPFRTYIPRDKQRSRYIQCRFKHKCAREKWEIFGISYTFRPISAKAYED